MLKSIFSRCLALGAFAVVPLVVAASAGASPITRGNFNNKGSINATASVGTPTGPAGTQDSLATFTSNLATAFANNTGGDYDATDNGNGNQVQITGGTLLSLPYGTGSINTLPFTSSGTFDSHTPGSRSGTSNSSTNTCWYYEGALTDTWTFGSPSDGSLLSTVGFSEGSPGITSTATFSYTGTAGAGSVTETGSNSGSFNDVYFEYTVPSGDYITSISLSNSGGYIVADDISFITTPTPEPAALSLVVLGAAGMLMRRRRASRA